MDKFFIWSSSKNNLWNLLTFSSVTFLLYSSYFSSQNIIVEIYDQFGYSSLGNLTILCFYLGNIISAIIFPGLLKYLSFRQWFFLSGLSVLMIQLACIFSYYCKENDGMCSFWTIYGINIICGLIVGFGNAINWISQAGYITNICTYDTKALFFSLFYSIFMASFMISAVITVLVLEYSQSQVKFFIFASVISVLAAVFYLLIPNVPRTNFITDEEKPNIKRINDILSLFWKKINRKVTFLSLFVGIEVGFYVSYLYSLIEETLEYVDDLDTNIKTAYVFVILGVFEMAGGFLSSWLGDRVRKTYLIFLGFLSLGLAFALINMILFVEANYLYCFLIGASAGFGDCILQSMINAMISCEENDVEHFSHYIVLQNLGSLVSVLFSIILPKYIYISYLFVSYFLCFLCVAYLK